MIVPPEPDLIIDSSVSNRIATELKRRGRNAIALSELGLASELDPDLLIRIHQNHPTAVLVTYDDHMPLDHGELIQQLNLTIAVIDPQTPDEYENKPDKWHHETVQRWCHLMQDQPQGTVYRYNATGRRVWIKPRRLKQAGPPAKPTAILISPPPQPKESKTEDGDQLTFNA